MVSKDMCKKDEPTRDKDINVPCKKFNYFSKDNLKNANIKRLPRKQKKKQKRYLEAIEMLFSYTNWKEM